MNTEKTYMNFGKCKRCPNDAIMYPTKICKECHEEFSKIPSPEEIGIEERKRRVKDFFEVSLNDAIQRNDTEAIQSMQNKAEKGETIRII